MRYFFVFLALIWPVGLWAEARLVFAHSSRCGACHHMWRHAIKGFEQSALTDSSLAHYRLEPYDLLDEQQARAFFSLIQSGSIHPLVFNHSVPLFVIVGSGMFSGSSYCALQGAVSDIYFLQWLKERVDLC